MNELDYAPAKKPRWPRPTPKEWIGLILGLMFVGVFVLFVGAIVLFIVLQMF